MSDASRRVGRSGNPPPPRAASPAIAVVVTLIAAVLGFFILKSLDDDNNGTGASPDTEETTTTGFETTSSVAVTTTIDKSSFQLLVANASGVRGSAGTLTTDLQSRGYRTLEATNVVPGYGPKEATEVFYLAGFETQAADVASVLGVTAQPMPGTKPVSDTDFVGATVLVVLGTDLAGQPLPGSDAATTETTASSTAETVAGSPNETTTTAAG
ncbi:MAG: LytR C-terminal domain-containing protein [Acidimicrobiia bacterium]